MKSFKFIIPLVLTCCFFLSFLMPKGSSDRLEQIKLRFSEDLYEFEHSIQSYSSIINEYSKGQVSKEKLVKAHISCRSAYKNVETYLSYFQPEAIKKFINGAPLPSIEKNTSALIVFEPKGLQTLDEIIAEDQPDPEALKSLINELQKEYSKMLHYQNNIELYDYQVFEANRAALVRVFTQGITGFDTPGTLNGLDESFLIIKKMKADFQNYKYLVSPELFIKMNNSFDMGLEQLKDPSFETFDRLDFLMECINPLYGYILEIQIGLGIELPHEMNRKPTAVNYMAENIFSKNFLDAAFFGQLEQGGDKASRQLLGRYLFFDPILSKDINGSCASCHNPEKGFSDGKKLSDSFDGSGPINRNAPGLINSVFADRYFHDLRASELKFQLDHVVYSPKEFDTDYKELVDRLGQSSTYRSLFQQSFSNRKHSLSAETIKLAINEYLASLVGFNSPFDKYVQGASNVIDNRVRNGFNLFTGKANCATCHFSPTFNGNVPPDFEESESEVLGVPSDSSYSELDSDIGRYGNKRDKEKADHYKFSFKTPTVRNISLTAPYMHNGVFSTLEEVMEFYNNGGGIGHGIDVPGQTLGPDSLGLSQAEISDIILFMENLTDEPIENTWPDSLPVFDNQPLWNSRYTKNSY